MALPAIVLGMLGAAGIGGLFGLGSSAMQHMSQSALNRESYKYTKLLQQQSYGYNKNLQNQSYNLSKKLQSFQNDYTTKMASSAHQLEVSDLRAAGLNPILSATGGDGASFTTGGATVGSASVGSGSVGAGSAGSFDIGHDAVSAAQGYLNAKQTSSNIKLNEKQGNNLDKDSDLKDALEATEKEKKENAIAERDAIKQRIKNEVASTAAQIRNLDKQGQAALINAGANVTSANAADKAASAKTIDQYLGKYLDQLIGPDVGKGRGYLKRVQNRVRSHIDGASSI